MQLEALQCTHEPWTNHGIQVMYDFCEGSGSMERSRYFGYSKGVCLCCSNTHAYTKREREREREGERERLHSLTLRLMCLSYLSVCVFPDLYHFDHFLGGFQNEFPDLVDNKGFTIEKVGKNEQGEQTVDVSISSFPSSFSQSLFRFRCIEF